MVVVEHHRSPQCSYSVQITTGTSFGRWTVLRPSESGLKKFYVCKCSCGTEKPVNAQNLKRGLSKSCGCYAGDLNRLHIPPPPATGLRGEGAAKHLLCVYKRNAQARGLTFSLTFDEFKKTTSSNCAYCGAKPSTVHRQNRANGDYTHNGIDRVDNSLGYTVSNTVPCCRMCNVAKNTHSLEDFKSWASRLTKHLLK